MKVNTLQPEFEKRVDLKSRNLTLACFIPIALAIILLPILVFSIIVIFQVYRSDHTYSKFRCRRDSTGRHIIKQCCEKWRIDDECVLCELKSNGG